MGRKWAGRLSGLKSAPWARFNGPWRGKSGKTPPVFWLRPSFTRWAHLLKRWPPSPTGLTAQMAQLARMAQRPSGLSFFRSPGTQGHVPLFLSGRRAWRRPRRRAHRRRRVGLETWSRRWGAPWPHHSLPVLTHARAARRPASSLLATARGATSSPGARVSPAR
jgi:hypothetical protein